MTPATNQHDHGKKMPHYEDKSHRNHLKRGEKQMAGEEQEHGKFSPGQSPDYNPEDFNTD